MQNKLNIKHIGYRMDPAQDRIKQLKSEVSEQVEYLKRSFIKYSKVVYSLQKLNTSN